MKFVLQRQQVDEGIRLCKQRLLSFLDDSELLCLFSRNPNNPVALYTIAVEEFGKLLMLQEALEGSNRGVDEFEVDASIFGYGCDGRASKFDAANDVLPIECRMFNEYMWYELVRYPRIFKRITRVVDANSVLARASFVQRYDFEVRKNLFYLDWDEQNNKWIGGYHIDSDRLLVAIETLREKIGEIS